MSTSRSNWIHAGEVDKFEQEYITKRVEVSSVTLIHKAGGMRKVSGMSPIDPTSLHSPYRLSQGIISPCARH